MLFSSWLITSVTTTASIVKNCRKQEGTPFDKLLTYLCFPRYFTLLVAKKRAIIMRILSVCEHSREWKVPNVSKRDMR
ncbi:hypothetical protein ACB098_02G193100 [Castanea mollissima]